jgi:hypothetical protein
MTAATPELPPKCIANTACPACLPYQPQAWEIVWLPHGNKGSSYGFSGNWAGFAMDMVRSAWVAART